MYLLGALSKNDLFACAWAVVWANKVTLSVARCAASDRNYLAAVLLLNAAQGRLVSAPLVGADWRLILRRWHNVS